jgi:hypothetical protein
MQVSKYGESPTHDRIDIFQDTDSKIVQTARRIALVIQRFCKIKCKYCT